VQSRASLNLDDESEAILDVDQATSVEVLQVVS